MPPFGPRIVQVMSGRDKDEVLGYAGLVFVISTLSFVAMLTFPIWASAILAFLSAHKGNIGGSALWAVIKAKKDGKNLFEEGAKAGLDAAAVEAISKFIDEKLTFL